MFYSGDLSLRSARHDYLPTFKQLIETAGVKKRWVLLDATMAGRPLGASLADASSDFYREAAEQTDVVIVSSDAEQLLYAYLDLFHHAKNSADHRSTTAFLLPSRIRRLFQVLHTAYMRRELDQLDPFLAAQYGSTMAAWGESRWLYWLDPLKPLTRMPHARLRIWFASDNDLTSLPVNRRTPVVPVGRVRDSGFGSVTDMQVLDVDSSPWTLHSDQESLRRAVVELSSEAQVVLFHNFPSRLRKFASQCHLDCQVLSAEPIFLD
jgi:hypothetical protein